MFDCGVNLFLVAFLFASGFFAGFETGRRKRMDKLEKQIEALEVCAGLRKEP